MLRKIETEERDSTSRSSFKCPTCLKTFTDLEADQLCDFATGEFRCSFCNTLVDEDQSAVPKQDSRMMLAKFNHQLEPLYNLLRDVEDIKLAPELLEPEPTDISALRRDMKPKVPGAHPGEHGQWSGDATRNRDFGMEHDVSISFGEDSAAASAAAKQTRKERPIWMVESTVAPEINEDITPFPTVLSIPDDTPQSSTTQSHQNDIMEVLLAHERKGGQSAPIIPGENANSSDSDSDVVNKKSAGLADVEEMDDDDDDEVTSVTIGDILVPLHEVTQELIAKMTPSEKETYIKLYQEAYSNMYD